MKKYVAQLLLLAMLVGALASCGGGTEQESKTADTAGNESDTVSSVQEEETGYLATLGKRDFDDADYIYMSQYDDALPMMNVHSGEINGELINDTQFQRDVEIMDDYNVNIEYIKIMSTDDIAETVGTSMASGEYICDVIAAGMCDGKTNLGALLSKGYLINLLDVPYLQLDQSWWSPLVYENAQYNGKLFFTVGDMAPMRYLSPCCLYMNLTLADNNHINESDIYQLVYDGKWTFDELYNLYNGLDTDLNGDGQMHCLDDFYGIVTENNILASDMFLVASGVKLCETDDDGKLTIAGLGSEKTVAVIDKMASYFTSVENDGANANLFDSTFKYDRALFAMHFVQSALLRFLDMDSDYAILPMPKYDVAQETYITGVNAWRAASFIGMPLVQEDVEKAGFITEVMEYKSVETVRPAVYDVTLKGRAMRNPDSQAMLNIVFSTTYVDFGCIYEFGNIVGAANSAIFQGSSYVSTYEKRKSTAESKLEEFMEVFA